MAFSSERPSSAPRPRPVVLCVLDGFGERAACDDNAVRLAKTPNLEALDARPRTSLSASGPDVGLPVGRVGSGEAGYRSLGEGRVPDLALTRIERAIDDEKLAVNENLGRLFWLVKERRDARMHLFALCSDGGVHASMRHLYALIDAAYYQDVPVVVHAILDGRDAPSKSAWRWIEPLLNHLEGKGKIGTLSGRDFAMDRDGHWDRTHRAYKAIVKADCPRFDDAHQALTAAYGDGATDAMLEPVCLGDYGGVAGSFMADFAGGSPRWDWYGEDVGLAANFRADRLRQLSAMLRAKNLPPDVRELLTERGRICHAFDEYSYAALTEVDPALALPVCFPPEALADTFGEVVARAGLTQLRCGAEGSRPHLTTYFGGGREASLDGEERRFVASPASDDPAAGAAELAREVAAAIEARSHDVIVVSFAHVDRAGHTGSLDAVVRAVEAVDAAVGVLASAVLAAGGALVVTSAHGSGEEMRNLDGPLPAHTLARVPLILVDDARSAVTLAPGRLADVAPTMLELLGLPQPSAMTGRSLLVGA